MMKYLLFTISILSALILGVNCKGKGHSAISPSPDATDCTDLIVDMIDCIPFITDDGGKAGKTDASCCSGFKKVVKANAECICEALKASEAMGFKVNITKAFTLPSSCSVPSPPAISKCGLSISPITTPAPAPANPSELSPALAPVAPVLETPAPSDGPGVESSKFAPAPTTEGPSSDQFPAISPSNSGSDTAFVNPCLILGSLLFLATFHHV